VRRHIKRYFLSYLCLVGIIACLYFLVQGRKPKGTVDEGPFLKEDRIRIAMQRLHVKGYLVESLPSVISYSSYKYGIDWKDIIATIFTESTFDEYAKGDSIRQTTLRAMGLGQILPSTGEYIADRLGLRWVGPETLWDPIFNVQATTYYLAEKYIIWQKQEDVVKSYLLGDARLRSYYDKQPDAVRFYKEQRADEHWAKFKKVYDSISDI
jgi:soluble lytic murein transglycosylase-like protein